MTLVALAIAYLAKIFTLEAAKAIFWKAFLFLLLFMIGPIVILKGYTLVVEALMEYAHDYLTEVGIDDVSVNITGFGGCLLNYLRIGEALSLYLTFAIVNLTLKILRLK